MTPNRPISGSQEDPPKGGPNLYRVRIVKSKVPFLHFSFLRARVSIYKQYGDPHNTPY